MNLVSEEIRVFQLEIDDLSYHTRAQRYKLEMWSSFHVKEERSAKESLSTQDIFLERMTCTWVLNWKMKVSTRPLVLCHFLTIPLIHLFYFFFEYILEFTFIFYLQLANMMACMTEPDTSLGRFMS